MKIRCLIIDDETPARDLIKIFLSDNANIEIIGECDNGFDAVKLCNELKPDLLFLDIQMPKLTGFEVIELLDIKPNIIFSTAYDQYALKAFELSAIDYLLKPYNKDRFNQALTKAMDSIGKKEITAGSKLLATREELNDSIDRVVIKNGAKIKILPITQINYIEAQDDYVMIYSTEGRFLKENTMKYFENHLNPVDFIRVHRSYIVNINLISKIEPYTKDTHVAILKDGSKIKVSDSGYKNLKDKLNF